MREDIGQNGVGDIKPTEQGSRETALLSPGLPDTNRNPGRSVRAPLRERGVGTASHSRAPSRSAQTLW